MKKKIPAITISLPQAIENMTIGELMRLPETEINVANNTFTARRKSEEGVTYFQYSQAMSGRTHMEVSTVPAMTKKSEYLSDILAMKSEGKKQKDIAIQLGISPAYVSELLKRNREE